MTIITATQSHIREILRLYEVLYADMARLQPFSYCRGMQDEEFLKTMIRLEDCDILLAVENSCIFGLALVMKQLTPADSFVNSACICHADGSGGQPGSQRSWYR